MLLGQILVREGWCDEADIIFALEEQDDGDSRKLGEILIEEKIINYYHLVMALSIQAEERDREQAIGEHQSGDAAVV
jgi:hypothetical protein